MKLLVFYAVLLGGAYQGGKLLAQFTRVDHIDMLPASSNIPANCPPVSGAGELSKPRPAMMMRLGDGIYYCDPSTGKWAVARPTVFSGTVKVMGSKSGICNLVFSGGWLSSSTCP